MQPHDRSDFASNRPHDQVSRLATTFIHIDVRKRVKTNDSGCRIDASLGVVSVKVKRHDDRDIWPDDVSDGLNEITVAIIDPFNDHRAMKVKQNSIHGAAV